MKITTSTNSAGNLVTKITKGDTTLSYIQDDYNCIVVYVKSPKGTFSSREVEHRSPLNELIKNLIIFGNLDTYLK